VDAKSVECGVGPVCRKAHGFDIECSEEARAEANELVYSIAAERDGAHVVEACKRLFELGFTNLVAAILKRIATVQVAVTPDNHPHGAGRLAVKTPYSVEAVDAMRTIPGRRWDKDAKVNTFPTTSKAALWDFFQKFYPGMTGVGPKGPFIVASPQVVS
jgi:hypothetical protein